MNEIDQLFNRIYQKAKNDSAVIGFFLSGSRGKSFESPNSDYDIRIVFAEGTDVNQAAEPYEAFQQSQVIEIAFFTLEELRIYAEFGSEFVWDRYSFAHVKALIDKTKNIQLILDAKGILPSEYRMAYLRESLDAFINSVYRSFKCHRVGNALGAKLEAISGISYLLNFIFALEGRHAPFLGYVHKELAFYPLKSFPLDSDTLITLIAEIADSASISAQQKFLDVIESLSHKENIFDVIEDWGEAYPWLMAYQRNLHK